MPFAEVDEAEYDRLQKLDRIARTIMGNPKSAKVMEQAYKIAEPTAPTPILDRDAAINEPLTALQKELADLRKERADDKADREKNEKLSQLSAQIDAGKLRLRRDGWTDDGLKSLDKFMEDRGLVDVEVAAAAYERMHPPASVANPSGSGAWNFLEGISDGEADLKKLVESKGNDEMILSKMVRDGLSEFRTARR
jgi:hypothetical protein